MKKDGHIGRPSCSFCRSLYLGDAPEPWLVELPLCAPDAAGGPPIPTELAPVYGPEPKELDAGATEAAAGATKTCADDPLRPVLVTNAFWLTALLYLAFGPTKSIVAALGPTLRPAITLEKFGGMDPPGMYAGEPAALPTRIVGLGESLAGVDGGDTGCQPAGAFTTTGVLWKLFAYHWPG